MKQKLKQSCRRALAFSRVCGLDVLRLIQSVRGVPVFFKNLKAFRRIGETDLEIKSLYPCLTDRYMESGVARGHYFHQDLLVAQSICHANPEVHYDVGSRVDGFVAHVAAFRVINVLDIRTIESENSNIRFHQADLMKDLPQEFVECCDSLSCLHTLEHFGLGRYGDEINPNGHVIGLSNLHAMLKPGGVFYFSVPIGPPRIEFDAHRVFSISNLRDLFNHRFDIMNFSYVDDRGDLHRDVRLEDLEAESALPCNYGCGIFKLVKI